MANGTHAPLLGARRGTSAALPGGLGRTRGDRLLLAVAAAYVLAQLLLVGPRLGLGWDETVYVSQISAQAPPAFFSAPRARGVSLLTAPVTSWSTSTPLLRVYLALLSGTGLYLALRIWRGLFPTRVLAVAGALYATLWVTLFYGPSAMPNQWVALGALVCAGCLLRARADPADRAAPWGLAAGAALMAWMRPTDAVWVSLPLLAVLLTTRRARPAAALLGGLATGGAAWIAEAYTSYGGLGARLAEASRVQGGLGWNPAVDDQLRALIGRTLCRPCSGALPAPLITGWWFALALLALTGLAVAVRARRPGPTLLLLACATTSAVPYLLFIGYAAPRFLLPAYALLALPAADALVRLVTAPGGGLRPVAATVAVLGLTVHLAVQYVVLDRTVDRTAADRRGWTRTAALLHRVGVRPPCLLTGTEAIPVAFYAGCSSANPRGNNANTTAEGIRRAARTTPVAALSRPGGPPPPYARGWTRVPAAGLDLHLAPRPADGGEAP
ncbi:hypothetical protein ACFWNK_09170 [Streptomyces sp. NPDC058417]|uniref:hypothetical protein n=1 Tax=unclassified Streptomyces TaxID=2593676 RepID=UPI00365DE690